MIPISRSWSRTCSRSAATNRCACAYESGPDRYEPWCSGERRGCCPRSRHHGQRSEWRCSDVWCHRPSIWTQHQYEYRSHHRYTEHRQRLLGHSDGDRSWHAQRFRQFQLDHQQCTRWHCTVNANEPDERAPSRPRQINLSWTASIRQCGRDRLSDRALRVGASCSNFTALTTVSTTSYSNTGLTNGTSYSYRVRAADAAGKSERFLQCFLRDDARHAGADCAERADSNGADEHSGINLSWTAATDNVAVTGYQIERCQGAGCTVFTQIGTTTRLQRPTATPGLTAGTPIAIACAPRMRRRTWAPTPNTASCHHCRGRHAGDASLKQTNNAVPQTPVSTVNVTFTAAQSAGDLNVVAIGWYDTTSRVLSVTDNRGNNYQRVAGPTTQAQGGHAVDLTTHPTSLPPRLAAPRSPSPSLRP